MFLNILSCLRGSDENKLLGQNNDKYKMVYSVLSSEVTCAILISGKRAISRNENTDTEP